MKGKTTITGMMRDDFNWNWERLMDAVKACPDELWNRKAGGDVYWQQIYHCCACADLFTMPAGASIDMGSQDEDVVFLQKPPSKEVSKSELLDYAGRIKAKADAWIDGIDDEALAQPHEGFSARNGSTFENARVLLLLSKHVFYHVGHCDALLREAGGKGVV